MSSKGNRLKLFLIALIVLISISAAVMSLLSYFRYQDIGNHYEQIKEIQQ